MTYRDTKGTEPAVKDFKRMADLVARAKGDPGKMVQLAANMGKAIRCPDKATRRAKAAVAVYPGVLGMTLAAQFGVPVDEYLGPVAVAA